ncbi:MAG: site-specific integrase [Polycyclovorans sp.]|nr:site-specific integrase [Polycyclovorans sp.]
MKNTAKAIVPRRARRTAAPGYIEKRGNNRFRAKITIHGVADSQTFSTRDAAADWLRQRDADARSGALRGRLMAETTTLRQGLTRYATEISSKKKSGGSEQGAIARMLAGHLAALADRPMSDIRTSDLADYVRIRSQDKNMRKGNDPLRQRRGELVSSATVRSEIAIVSHLYNVARARWGYDGLHNPVTPGLRPKCGRGRERRLEAGEEARLMAAAMEYEAASRHRPSPVPIVSIIRFALMSAMRAGEIAEVRASRINFSQASILLPASTTKNGRARTVALAPSAVRLLRSMPTFADDRPIFGKSSAFLNAWKFVRDRAGLDDFRFHDLRHEAVSRLFEETNLSESEIATISGHLTPQMLRRYTHLRVSGVVAKLAESEARRSLLPQHTTGARA